jgi:hypothetical protein
MLTLKIEKCSSAASTGRPQTVSEKALNTPEQHSNIFTESLKDYFTQFGEVTECTVMRDGVTGRSRGFGFLTFKDPKVVNVVMVKEHLLDGKLVSLILRKSVYFHHSSSLLTDVYRLTLSAQSHVTNRRRPRRFSSEVCPRRPPRQTSANSSHSSVTFSTVPS